MDRDCPAQSSIQLLTTSIFHDTLSLTNKWPGSLSDIAGRRGRVASVSIGRAPFGSEGGGERLPSGHREPLLHTPAHCHLASLAAHRVRCSQPELPKTYDRLDDPEGGPRCALSQRLARTTVEQRQRQAMPLAPVRMGCLLTDRYEWGGLRRRFHKALIDVRALNALAYEVLGLFGKPLYGRPILSIGRLHRPSALIEHGGRAPGYWRAACTVAAPFFRLPRSSMTNTSPPCIAHLACRGLSRRAVSASAPPGASERQC